MDLVAAFEDSIQRIERAYYIEDSLAKQLLLALSRRLIMLINSILGEYLRCPNEMASQVWLISRDERGCLSETGGQVTLVSSLQSIISLSVVTRNLVVGHLSFAKRTNLSPC